MLSMHLRLLGAVCAAMLAACSASTMESGDAGVPDASSLPGDGGSSPGKDSGLADAAPGDGSVDSGSACTDTLSANRDCLLRTYFDFLKKTAVQPQSNGLSGANVASVCDVWSKLDPSSQAVFLTLTARMQGSTLGSDGSSMLSHIKKLYRVTGGQKAGASDPGSCGGGEYNRMMMSMDDALHAALLAASKHKGAMGPDHKYDLADVVMSSFWRDSHDLGGPHAPFDLSDETNQGAPRGQTQYFADPTASRARSPLGRMDLMSLVDPYALELDQDYDCIHNSNPLCKYSTYGPLCAPKMLALGTDIYKESYGDFAPGWKPSGCP